MMMVKLWPQWMFLAPGIGEIIGGSQRERLDILDKRMEEMGLNPEDYWWYHDLRNMVPYHIQAFFGLGFERLIVYAGRTKYSRCDSIPSRKNANF